MARFLIRVVAFTTIQLTILIFVWCYGTLDTSDHYLSAIYDKRELLESTKGPRLIFVGGSNVAFGINCEIFKNHLSAQPINLGLHAGLGLDFPLRLAEEGVRKGDTVVVIPEYGLLTSEQVYDGNSQTIVQLLEQWPEGRRFFNDDETVGLKQLLDHKGLWLTHLRVLRARHRLGKCLGAGKGISVYSRQSFNEYGDVVGHYDVDCPRFKEQPILAPDDEAFVQLAISRLNRFAAVCSRKGARVLFAYQPFPRSTYENNRETIEKLERTLTETLDIPIVHAPEEVTYRRELFFDNANHLNKEGTSQRSEFLLTRIVDRLPDIASLPRPVEQNTIAR